MLGPNKRLLYVISAPLVSLRTAEASEKHCLLPPEGSASLVSVRTAEASEKRCLVPTEKSGVFFTCVCVLAR